jgi:ribosomal protein S14
MVAQEERTDMKDYQICTRCGEAKGFNSYNITKCKDCQREIADEEFLDSGSESVIRENADRPKQVRVDLHEQESYLDKLLEEY